ncbi:hypothetical protein CY35_05G027900 [Sphagnum magellanicum]|nr:hypothetical protein CY35_05G027900 [Sphagnum magellanicum]
MDRLLSQETTSTGQASTGSRGISPLPTGVPKLSTSYKVPGKGKNALVYVDSFPSADGWWTLPLHGEDVA